MQLDPLALSWLTLVRLEIMLFQRKELQVRWSSNFMGTKRIVSAMSLVPEYVSGENEKLANNKFIFSGWLVGFRLVNNLYP